MREGWKINLFGEVFKFRQGIQRGVKLQSETKQEGQVRFVRIIDYTQGNELPRYIDNPGKQYLLDENAISLVRYGASTGFVCRGIKGALANNLFRVIPNDKWTINSDYLYYFLNSPIFQSYIKSKMNGAAMPAISFGMISKIPFPTPPIEEQKQIVALLDKAFTAIDQAKANIEKNIANAKELFQSRLNDIFSQKGDGWEEKKFQDVCVLQRGFDLPKRLREQGENPLVSSSGIIDTHVEAKIKAPGVVTGRSGSIGNLFYIEKDFWPLNTTLYIKDFKGNSEEYVYYFIKQFDLKRFSSGAGVPTLNRNFVHDEIVFSTNNIELQKKIVNQLNDLKSEIKEIENQYQKKLNDLEDLKKSILQKAFAGELTSPNGTKHSKEVRSASVNIANKKSPERTI